VQECVPDGRREGKGLSDFDPRTLWGGWTAFGHLTSSDRKWRRHSFRVRWYRRGDGIARDRALRFSAHRRSSDLVAGR